MKREEIIASIMWVFWCASAIVAMTDGVFSRAEDASSLGFALRTVYWLFLVAPPFVFLWGLVWRLSTSCCPKEADIREEDC